jgi:hypothetical protein
LENAYLCSKRTPLEQFSSDSELYWSSLTFAEMALQITTSPEFYNYAGASALLKILLLREI